MNVAFNVIVLAGDRGPGDQVAQAAGVARKVLAPVAGRPMLAYALDHAARIAGGGRIIVLANRVDEVRDAIADRPEAQIRALEFREGAEGPARSVAELLAREDLTPAIILTGDHPLLSRDVVTRFCAEAAARPVDILAAFVPKSGFREEFPEVSRTFIRFGGEAYSGANIFALLTRDALNAVEFWTNVEKDRKKSLKLVRAFGWGNLFRVLLRKLDLDAAMKRASLAFGAEVRAVVVEDPAAAMDVDRPEHLSAARRRLEGKG